MTEKKRLIKLFENLYNGHPWIDVTLYKRLHRINAKVASKKTGKANTIWEIVNHIIAWRRNVMKRLEGQIITTPWNNYIKPVKDKSEANWEKTLIELDATQQEWIAFLKKFDMKKLNDTYPKNGLTYYEHIQGIIQHDAYHLGQIVLLAKMTRS